MAEQAREIELLVLSDIHLGTTACQAGRLKEYLKTVRPRILVLNGDIIDLTDGGRRGWSEDQTKVVRRLLKYLTLGTRIHYITGNHDAAVRAHTPLLLGGIEVVDRLELDIGGERTWFVHGDAFDRMTGTSPWLAWLGARSYDTVVASNHLANRFRSLAGLPAWSIAAWFKRNLPAAQAHIARFERACAHAAAARGCSVVVAGHIHVPADRTVDCGGRRVRYLNSGDWVDSCSALEFDGGAWSVARPLAIVAAAAA